LSGEFKEGEEVTVSFQADEAAPTPTSAQSAPVHTNQLTAADREQLGPELAAIVERYPASSQKGLARSLIAAGDNQPALPRALKYALPTERDAMGFLVANMPEVDAQSLSSTFLLRNVRLASRRASKRHGAETSRTTCS